jgi:hypothetical protein
MAGETDGSSGSSDLQAQFRNLRNAATRENITRVVKQETPSITGALGKAAAYLNGETPAITTPAVTQDAAGSAIPPITPTAPPAPAAAAPKEEKPEGEKPTEEDTGWVANLLFKIAPPELKNWGATVSIPMITQGQAMLAKQKKPRVSSGPMALFECLGDGEEVKVIPKTVKDYATQLLEAVGIVQKDPQTSEAKESKDNLVTALSVGFINFIKSQIGRFFPGIKCFNDAANNATPSENQLIGFATNPQTFVSLFNMVGDGSRKVDDTLYDVFKTEFAKKEGIQNIDQYFSDDQGQPLKEITYAQFVQGYARLGNQQLTDNKWPATMKDMSDEDRDSLLKSSASVLQKYGIDDDTSGTLANGLAIACMHGADLVSGLMKAPKPGETPAPAAPAPAKPPGTP